MVFSELAAGGMAAVSLGRLLGPVGFSRTVAIKEMHANLAKDPAFVAMFLDEARVASRIHHPNVCAILDIVLEPPHISLVLEYVHGESLARLEARTPGAQVPPRIASGILINVLSGLHAAHEARADSGEPLQIVHRDVSPQNILVGVDGVARVLDFGIAKAAQRATATTDGAIKGKVAYMAPEQLGDGDVDRRTDVYAAGIVLWEALSGAKTHVGGNTPKGWASAWQRTFEPPSRFAPGIPAALDDVVLRALAREPSARFQSARDFALALETAMPPATAREIGEWVAASSAEALAARERLVALAASGDGAGQGSTLVSPRDGREQAQIPTQPIAAIDGVAPSNVSTPGDEGLSASISTSGGSGRSRRVVLAAGILGSIALVVMLFAMRRNAGSAAAAPPTPVSTPSGVASVSVEPPTSAVAEVRATPAFASATPPAAPAPSPATRMVRAAGSPRPAGRPAATHPAASAARSAECEHPSYQPVYVDGIKTWVPTCPR